MTSTKESAATYTLSGKEYPITGYVKTEEYGTLPIVGVPMMSDYKWMKGCLEGRLKNPEVYARFENVDEVIAQLQSWLAEHDPE